MSCVHTNESEVEKSMENVINDFDAMLASYQSDDEENQPQQNYLECLVESGGENFPIDMSGCFKCHGRTPLCSECNLILLNRPNIDHIDVSSEERNSSFDIFDTPPRDEDEIGEKSTKIMYDAELSMTENALEREVGVTYGRGVEVIKERKNLSVFRVLDFSDVQDECLSGPEEEEPKTESNDNPPVLIDCSNSPDTTHNNNNNVPVSTINDEHSEDNQHDIGKETSETFIALSDSKRFNRDDACRVIQGLFVESKSTNGTLKRLKVPLDIVDNDDLDDKSGENSNLYDEEETNGDHEIFYSAAKSPRSHKKKISVDAHIRSIVSEMDESDSDIFYSIINSPMIEERMNRTEDDEEITLDLDNTDYAEQSILDQLESTTIVDKETTQELTASSLEEDERSCKLFRIAGKEVQIDLQAIQPYRRVMSHGGYADAEKKVAIILFSGCYLPDRSRKEYSYLLDHLFFFVLWSLEKLVTDEYILVYVHGATPKSCTPPFNWLKRCYQQIDRRLRKNLKGLYLVHPTFWLKATMAFANLFVSSKFTRKIKFMENLSELSLEFPTEHLFMVIPERVLQYDTIKRSRRRH